MVLPLVQEDYPKCYLCYKGFGSIEELRAHQKEVHLQGGEQKQDKGRGGKQEIDGVINTEERGPAPGDVSIF